MSRRSSSRSPYKGGKSKGPTPSPGSLETRLRAKGAEGLEKLSKLWSFTKKTASDPAPKKKEKDLRKICAPGKAKRSQDKASANPAHDSPAAPGRSQPSPQRALVELFEDINRTDGIQTNEEEISDTSKKTLSKWGNGFRTLQEVSLDQSETPVDVIIGFDFGTSSVKIIVRFPYEGEDGTAFAFVAPEELRADNHPHCCRTLLWIEPHTKELSLFYKKGFGPITELKTTAMQSNSSRGQDRATKANLQPEMTCIAYVGLMLRLVKGWLASDIFCKMGIDPGCRPIKWELNMGLPASKKDEKSTSTKFEKIAKFSWKLSNQWLPLFAEKIDPLIRDMATAQVSASISIRPEVVAQTVGFLQTSIADFGYYATVDVGASTLDICTFNFVNSSGEEKFNLFYSNVKLLGSESPNWIKVANKQFGTNFNTADLKSAIQTCFGETLITTKRKKVPYADEWSSVLPIFLCGGGKHSIIHTQSLEDYSMRYESDTAGKLEFREVAIPKVLEFECANTDYHRLSVAWGLSTPQLDFSKYTMPSDIEDAVRNRSINIEDRYIGAEQV